MGASRASPACACPAWSVVMDLLMSCGRRDEHARMLRPVCCRPQLSTACSVVTSRRLAVIMAHSRLGTAERQMWRLHNPCGLMCGDGCLLCSGSRTLDTTAFVCGRWKKRAPHFPYSIILYHSLHLPSKK